MNNDRNTKLYECIKLKFMQSIVSLCLGMMHSITRLMNMIYSETVISQNINFMCHIRCFRPETIEKKNRHNFFSTTAVIELEKYQLNVLNEI